MIFLNMLIFYQSQAYDICIKRDLLREQVFLLGRMGNSKQALAVIINQLGDIEEVLCKFLFSSSGGSTSQFL